MTFLLSAQDLQRTRGLSKTEICRNLRSGALVSVKRGWYRENSPISPIERHRVLVEATARSLSPDTVVSHASAAVVHGLPVPFGALGRVCVTRRGGGHGGRRKGLYVSQSPLPDEDVLVVSGVAVTTTARTVLDVARTVPFEWGVAVIDSYLRESSDPTARLSLLDRLARETSRRGNPKAKAAVGVASPLAESPGESISRVIFARNGLPDPILQHEIPLANGRSAFADFAWDKHNTLGEFDGAIKYAGLLPDNRSPAKAVLAEKAREQALRDAGWWFVRWDWDDLRDEEALAKRIRRAFELAPRWR